MTMNTRLVAPIALLALFWLPLAEPADQPPAPGHFLVAADDCGYDPEQPHLAVGNNYTFSEAMVSGDLAARTCAWDPKVVVMQYGGLLPSAAYKLEIVYVTERNSQRVQRLEASGQQVHGDLSLPAGEPKTFLFDLPKAGYADGKLELRFIHVGGANAVVSVVKVWSTDTAKLTTPVRGRGLAWPATDPVEADWARQDALRGKPTFEWKNPKQDLEESVLPCLDELLDRGGRMLADFAPLGGDQTALAKSAAELSEIRKHREGLLTQPPDAQAWLKLYVNAHWAVRRLAFLNPLLAHNGILFVRRHHSSYMHQCARRLGPSNPPGGDLCILSADGTVRSLTAGRLPPGVFGRPDLSFDGKRLVFGYALARQDAKPFSEKTALEDTGYCYNFQVWEMGLDGSGLRQLTEGPSENSDPIYLPNGRIAFMSDRAGGRVQCGDWAKAYCVFTMNPDGSDVRQITMSKDGEWDPCLLDDGTILFTRWEYVMKFWSPIQFLWSVRPDGTGAQLIYGNDLSRKGEYPLNFALARQIPGTSKLVSIGSAHHNTGSGPVCLIDLRHGRDGREGLVRLTPVEYVETGEKPRGNGWYDCPYPLSDKYFLVSYSFERQEQSSRAYGLYLLDAYGGKELIHRDKELSCMFPVLLKPRKRPVRLAESPSTRQEDLVTLILADVNQGLPPEAHGQAKFLRIAEAHERKIHTKPYNIQVGPDSGFETKSVLGTVPIEADGSAHFRVPAGKSVFFQVLDENHLALHVMRSVINFQPGETRSCVGCHEPMAAAPGRRPALAARRAPSDLTPPPWGTDAISFEKHIQPLLDRQCTRCHDGATGKDKSFDLTAKSRREFMTVPMAQSYFNLRRHVKHAPIYTYVLPPLSFGSRQSKVMQILRQGHYDAKLAPADWQLLASWIDCNAPYIGDYAVVAAQK